MEQNEIFLNVIMIDGKPVSSKRIDEMEVDEELYTNLGAYDDLSNKLRGNFIATRVPHANRTLRIRRTQQGFEIYHESRRQ